MVKKFITEKEEKKALLNATIDIDLMDMLKKLSKKTHANLSKTTNNVLRYFKTDLEAGEVEIELPEEYKERLTPEAFKERAEDNKELNKEANEQAIQEDSLK